MDVELVRGERYMMLSGYKSHRIAELYSKLETDQSHVKISDLRELKEQSTVFEENSETAEAFLQETDEKNCSVIGLKDFIFYFSLLIAPKIKNDDFDKAIDA